ncbi:MAG: UDP-N-acetylmuramoyl-L-alanyl-D-glutamate--2,6-di aminopimelate ligase [Syntrophus sp. SKADARSKE-3]|nr:UDP-N-acetylmuramoyl-L-alanyl-D-glutamate--2,6-di aminopimelate ligase [Syntrophus sp. SKADARSKE-3]
MHITKLLENMKWLDVQGDLSGDVASICYDSRQCGEQSLFIAVSGLKVDGHAYVTEAVKRGARFIIHEKDIPAIDGVTMIRVENSRQAMSILGRNFFADPSSQMCLIGVTGTNGKTTVSYMMESIFRAAGYAAGVLGTVNYRYGDVTLPAPNTTPESLDMQRILGTMSGAGVTHVVAEVSSHAVDLGRVDDCDFDLGVFTNLSQDHLDYHETMERYFDAKKRFFSEILPRSKKKRPVQMVVNKDDPWGRRLLDEIDLPAWGFGIEEQCEVKAAHYKFSLDGIGAEIRTECGRFSIESPLIGKFNLYNVLAAAAAALSLNVPKEAIVRGIADLKSIPGRLERVNRRGEPHVFVDYAHTDDALHKVLENLQPFRRHRIITVFGCGGDRDPGKRPLMARAAAMGSDRVILTSDNPRSEDPLEILKAIEQGIPKDMMAFADPTVFPQVEDEKAYTVMPDRQSAIEAAIAMADVKDIVLIAGKGHEDYQILGNKKIYFDDRVVSAAALSHSFDRRGAS